MASTADPRWNATDCTMCRSLTVVPLGADVIRRGITLACFPGPSLQVAVVTRKPGTNDFGTRRIGWHGMTMRGHVRKKTPRFAETVLPKGRREGPRGQMVRLLLLLVLPVPPHVSALPLHDEDGSQRGPVQGVGLHL